MNNINNLIDTNLFYFFVVSSPRKWYRLRVLCDEVYERDSHFKTKRDSKAGMLFLY
jgi:plasmid replication initiation protein